MEKLLIVEDNEDIRRQLRWGLDKEYETFDAGDRTEALALFRRHSPRVVTLDLGLPPDESGIEEGFRCLEQILHLAPATKVIMITGNDDRENALRAVQSGAYDYYCKPVDIAELKVILKRAFHLAAIEKENSRLHHSLDHQGFSPAGIIGQSPRMLEVFSSIRKVASSDVAVLITGESGTGKELVAKAIHGLSQRKSGAFMAINCGAIPENLLESELFGYEKGAFSGAHTRVQGKVEYAHKGSLFLDEIGELPLNLQVKLLRFLQEKTIQRVGGREDIPVDARIIAATNRDIAKETESGNFREDLYYRVSVIHISLPPLRDRGEDIMLLANLFLRRASEEFRKKVRRFSSEAVKLLESYDWPGNVRELENKVQRAVIMSDSTILEPEVLAFSQKSLKERMFKSQRLTLKDAREMIEREMVISAIENQRNNMAKAAEVLGISRPTLYDLVKKHSIFKAAD
ncbi:PEP-CTERM-box response regulator transcription factor [Geobacter sp. SVR]|uniref:PEP-CTERM-box response regulator transcription factor n=1 Tax=Geobacter sp. SVR TaxID=2495594 RepID=UPI00143EFA38|nr:PEP-CTERM-box response regulator transcription factor [Geobacter sp. SVR]BCS54947.1 sigma-54-dependent Fis family transcriptional regulator [Geobacter sp. SVR]GCF86146.1 sigma-54-dependent Fis family transcriptional regulator [Geobacter sp. SVR]